MTKTINKILALTLALCVTLGLAKVLPKSSTK